jgi:hypothetical protein
MSAQAPSLPRNEEGNKTIVDRWLMAFWGKDYNPAIVDELAAPIRLQARKTTEEIGLADGVTALSQLQFIRVSVWPA